MEQHIQTIDNTIDLVLQLQGTFEGNEIVQLYGDLMELKKFLTKEQ